jgi:hypothetical protein
MRVKGLPIGQGELWHDPVQRATTLVLVVLALAPFLGWIFPALGVLTPGRYQMWVEPPLLALLAAGCLFAGLRQRTIAARVGVGLVVGLVGALSYDLSLYLARVSVPGVEFPLPPFGLPIGMANGPGEPWPVHLHHWLGAAAAWGLAFALLTGKARWYFGPVWGALMWGLLVVMALLLPRGHLILATPTVGPLVALLAVHLIYGLVIGALNELLQPQLRGKGKIVFLRDYVARVKQH